MLLTASRPPESWGGIKGEQPLIPLFQGSTCLLPPPAPLSLTAGRQHLGYLIRTGSPPTLGNDLISIFPLLSANPSPQASKAFHLPLSPSCSEACALPSHSGLVFEGPHGVGGEGGGPRHPLQGPPLAAPPGLWLVTSCLLTHPLTHQPGLLPTRPRPQPGQSPGQSGFLSVAHPGSTHPGSDPGPAKLLHPSPNTTRGTLTGPCAPSVCRHV